MRDPSGWRTGISGTTIAIDPASSEAAEPVDPLVRSRGSELGVRASAVDGLRSPLSLWTLDLNSEFVFVGDAGATEPATSSHRRGITFANFYRPHPSLSADADLSLARARLRGSTEEGDRVPGAMGRVFTGGIAWGTSRGRVLAGRTVSVGALCRYLACVKRVPGHALRERVKREPGAIPGRPRRCEGGRGRAGATVTNRHGKALSRG